MTAPAGEPLASYRTFTPLGLALHDVITDARVVTGLRVDARPVGGGRVTPAFQTRSGAYGFRGLEGVRAVEFPEAADREQASPPLGDEVLVSVLDTQSRFVATVLRVPVPTQGLVTQSALLPEDSPPADELPVYLFSSPSRELPAQFALVRAQLAEAATGEPARFSRLEVVVNPASADRRRYVGVADATGAVVVPVPYPRFVTGGDTSGSPPAGSVGQPPVQQTWPVEIRVRYEPDVLEHHPGLVAPTLNSVLIQGEAPLWAGVGSPPQPVLQAELRFGVDLIVRTAGEEESRLLIGGASP